MSSEPQRHRRVYLFGQHPDERNTVEQAPIVADALRWLTGEPVPMTPELEHALRLEFAAQEQFRVRVWNEVNAEQQRCVREAGKAVEHHDEPIRASEAMERGVSTGKYQVYAEVAERLADVLNGALAEVKGQHG